MIRVDKSLNKIIVNDIETNTIVIFDIVAWTTKEIVVDQYCQYFELPSENLFNRDVELEENDLPYYAEVKSSGMDARKCFDIASKHINKSYNCALIVDY